MALIKAQNLTITRHVGDKGAYAAEETITLPDGRTFPRSYTIWTKEPHPVGTLIDVVGELSVKGRTYGDNKIAVDISINNPQVTTINTPIADDEVPF